MINFISLLLLLFSVIQTDNFNPSFEEDIFPEYRTEDFLFKEHNAKIVFPPKANDQRSWIWRARFWGHEPQVDKALLDQGFHLAYIDVAGLYGNKEAEELWNCFYEFITQKYDLNSKVVLEGMSRGGLIVYNWTAQNTEKVACIYGDAPVLDIKSWPGGLYQGEVSTEDWEACLKAYDLDEKSVMDFEGIPLNAAETIVAAKIPVLHVCGEADQAVPYAENTEIFARRIKQGIGTAPWAGIFSTGKCYMLQSDLAVMIDSSSFERFVIPDLIKCCDHLDHAFYHLDGKEQIQHLDLLFSIPNLHGIQWIPGAGNPPPEEWMDLLKRIRDAGKLCQLYVTPHGARKIKKNLEERGLLFISGLKPLMKRRWS